MAVNVDVFAVSARAGKARRSMRQRPTNSAARCCASAALPPLPMISNRFPRPSAWLIIFAARETPQINSASSRMASCTWIFAARIPWTNASPVAVVATAISSPGLQTVKFKAELRGYAAQFPHRLGDLMFLFVFAVEQQVSAAARSGNLSTQRAMPPSLRVHLVNMRIADLGRHLFLEVPGLVEFCAEILQPALQQ